MNAEQLIDQYLETVDPLKPKRPKHKSLAQKQGSRKAGRTRQRRQYAEKAGYLLHHYYVNRDQKDNP